MREARRVLRPSGRYLATANSLASYPQTAEYRTRIHHEFGWGEPVFTTSRVSLECLTETLAPYWRTVELRVLNGELRIPHPEYVTYFAANIPTWAHPPTNAECMEILTRIERWSGRRPARRARHRTQTSGLRGLRQLNQRPRVSAVRSTDPAPRATSPAAISGANTSRGERRW